MLGFASSDVGAAEPEPRPASDSPDEHGTAVGSHCDAVKDQTSNSDVARSVSCTNRGDTPTANCHAKNVSDGKSTEMPLPFVKDILLKDPVSNARGGFDLRDVEEILSAILAEIDNDERVRQTEAHKEEKEGTVSFMPGVFQNNGVPEERKGLASVPLHHVAKNVHDSVVQSDEAKFGGELGKKRSGHLSEPKQKSVKRTLLKSEWRHDVGNTSDKIWSLGAGKSKKESSATQPNASPENKLDPKEDRQLDINKLAMDKKISWGKAKAYPESLTLSELNDEGTGTSKTRSLKRTRKKKPAADQVTKRKINGISLLRSMLGIPSPATVAAHKSASPRKPHKQKTVTVKGEKKLGKENQSKKKNRKATSGPKRKVLDTLHECGEEESSALSDNPARTSDASSLVGSETSSASNAKEDAKR
ncbi:unnamed protein product [Ixodes hexagonus]